MNKYWMYILHSVKGTYYIGSTNNIKKRLVYHNDGRVLSTKAGCPWKVIYSENFDKLLNARKREMQIKKWKSRHAIDRLINKGPIV